MSTPPSHALPQRLADPEKRQRRLEGGADILVCSHTSNRNLGILCPDTPRLAAVSTTGKRTAQSIGSLLSTFQQKDNEKGRQECPPHLHTHFLNGSTSHCAGWS